MNRRTLLKGIVVIAGFLIQTQFLSTWAIAGCVCSIIGWTLIAVMN